MALVAFPLSIIACTTGEADSSLSMSLTLNKLSRVTTVEEKMQSVPLTYVPGVSSSAVLHEKREPEIQNKHVKRMEIHRPGHNLAQKEDKICMAFCKTWTPLCHMPTYCCRRFIHLIVPSPCLRLFLHSPE